MRKEFFVGLLLVLLLAFQSSVPEKSPQGERVEIAFEQADILTQSVDNVDILTQARVLGVVISPGLAQEAATTEAYSSADLESCNLNELNLVVGLRPEPLNRVTLAKHRKKRSSFMLNHKLYEISPGDIQV